MSGLDIEFLAVSVCGGIVSATNIGLLAAFLCDGIVPGLDIELAVSVCGGIVPGLDIRLLAVSLGDGIMPGLDTGLLAVFDGGIVADALVIGIVRVSSQRSQFGLVEDFEQAGPLGRGAPYPAEQCVGG